MDSTESGRGDFPDTGAMNSMKLQRSSWITAVVLTVLMITGNLTAAQAQTLELSPVITQQPASVSIQEAAGQATFNVAYSGEPEPTVRWERSTNQGATWQDLTGSSSVAVAGGQLTLEGLTSDDHGAQVRAVVTNDIGEVISEPAELHIETVVEKLPAEVEAQTPQTPLSQDTPADEQPHIEHAPEITQPERRPTSSSSPMLRWIAPRPSQLSRKVTTVPPGRRWPSRSLICHREPTPSPQIYMWAPIKHPSARTRT